MREQLKQLIQKTLIFEYELPNLSENIERTIFSNLNDRCYSTPKTDALTEVIYNSIVEYALNQNELGQPDYSVLHELALKRRLKYNPDDDDAVQLKYGFFGEVLLYCILHTLFDAAPIISRGALYNVLENSESKGFDSYHLIETPAEIHFWFGEVKFHKNHTSTINSALKKINICISDEYLEKNFLVLCDRCSDINDSTTKTAAILKEWKKQPRINIKEESEKHGLKLVYPVFLLFDENSKGFHESIRASVKYIQENYTLTKFNTSIPVSIFFVFLPVHDTINIKKTVLKWIEEKKQLIS